MILRIIEVIALIILVSQVLIPWMFPSKFRYFWFFRKDEEKNPYTLSEKDKTFEENLKSAKEKTSEAIKAKKVVSDEAEKNLKEAEKQKREADKLK